MSVLLEDDFPNAIPELRARESAKCAMNSQDFVFRKANRLSDRKLFFEGGRIGVGTRGGNNEIRMWNDIWTTLASKFRVRMKWVRVHERLFLLIHSIAILSAVQRCFNWQRVWGRLSGAQLSSRARMLTSQSGPSSGDHGDSCCGRRFARGSWAHRHRRRASSIKPCVRCMSCFRWPSPDSFELHGKSGDVAA